jgi:hypothetical protein
MEDQPNNTVSRRSVLKTGVSAVGAATIFGVTAANAQVAKKAAHASAGYQETANAGKSCSTCRQFQPPSSCLTVESPVNANGWCRLYAKKA